jgi:hypothetical protein
MSAASKQAKRISTVKLALEPSGSAWGSAAHELLQLLHWERSSALTNAPAAQVVLNKQWATLFWDAVEQVLDV